MWQWLAVSFYLGTGKPAVEVAYSPMDKDMQKWLKDLKCEVSTTRMLLWTCVENDYCIV